MHGSIGAIHTGINNGGKRYGYKTGDNGMKAFIEYVGIDLDRKLREKK